MTPAPDPHYRHRFPAEIIGHAVWLYHVFSLSLRDVELLLAERGIVVSYETVRRWCKKFGQSFANRLRRRWPRPGEVANGRLAVTELLNPVHAALRCSREVLPGPHLCSPRMRAVFTARSCFRAYVGEHGPESHAISIPP